jgi:small subunit ribosomal protein S8
MIYVIPVLFLREICFDLLKKIPYITSLKRISKPGLRVYVSQRRIPRVLNGVGIAILSTTQGIMTDRTARANKIGGEVLCYVW